MVHLKFWAHNYGFEGMVEVDIPCKNADDIWRVLSVLRILQEDKKPFYIHGEGGRFTKVE